MARRKPNETSLRRWDRKGYPHKGWTCNNVSEAEESDGSCEMCGETGLRWIHELKHLTQGLSVDVGRVCAGHLQEDYDKAASLQRLALNKSKRKKTFLAYPWSTHIHTDKGTLYYIKTRKAEIRVTHNDRGWLISDFHRRSDLKHFRYEHDYSDIEKIKGDLFEIHDTLSELQSQPRPF